MATVSKILSTGIANVFSYKSVSESIIGKIFDVSVSHTYVPPEGDAVNFTFEGTYTPPAGDGVNFNF